MAFRDVVSHCIYGVDINPMAVELCKVALWLESIDPGKPLSFLDHRILCGNSLIGVTPRLLAEGIPDAAFKPIEGDDKETCKQLKQRNKEERTGESGFLFDLKGKVYPWERLGNLVQAFADLAAMDDGSLEDVQAKEKKYAEFVESTGYQSARLLADAWCAAFVWKKDKATDDCITESWFRRIEANPHCLPPWMREQIDRLRDQYQFFHWHLAFPDAFRVPSDDESPDNEQAGWSGGFAVVLGNPPWERIKLQEKEWFAPHRPDIANAPKAAQRRRMIEALREDDPNLFDAFMQARRRAEGDSHMVRQTGRFPLCGRGDVNTYALFAETMRTILARVGRVGCIVPSGIATDDTTKHYFRDLTDTESLATLHSFENEEFIFPAVHHATKFCLLTLAGPDRPQRASDFLFFARQTSDIKQPDRHFTLTAGEIGNINPNTRTCPIFRCRRDANIVKAIYQRIPILIDETPPESNPWGLTFLRMFDMTNDSSLFHTRQELEAQGYALDGNIFRRDDSVFSPLYEGKMIWHFDHRFGTYDGQTQAQANQGKLPELDTEQHSNPAYLALPRYWICESDLRDVLREGRASLLVFRDVTSSVVLRTSVCCVIPAYPCGNNLPVAVIESRDGHDHLRLAGCLASFVFDYVTRQKLGGSHMNFFILKQLPVPEPRVFSDHCAWQSGKEVADWLLPRELELTYCAWDMVGVAVDCGVDTPPFRWDEGRRFLIRCELDAAYFHLYGIERDDVGYIMETFPIVKRRDIARTEVKDNSGEVTQKGRYITKDTILEIYDEMAEAMKTGKPYQTRLDPPPGPPADAEGNFLPLPQWLPGQRRPADWPPHIHGPKEVYDWAKTNDIDWRSLLESEDKARVNRHTSGIGDTKP